MRCGGVRPDDHGDVLSFRRVHVPCGLMIGCPDARSGRTRNTTVRPAIDGYRSGVNSDRAQRAAPPRSWRRGAVALAGIVALAACQSSNAADVERPSTVDAQQRSQQDADRDQPSLESDDVTVVTSDFDVSDHVVVDESGVPESSADEPSGNFRFLCEYSHLGYDDPIVYPGEAGASHLHMFFGNDEADASSTYESLRAGGGSSCHGGPVNRSAYWAPAVMTPEDQVVVPDYISVYYKGPGRAPDGSLMDVEDLPPGLRMIAGQNPADPVDDSPHDWYCEVNQVKSDRIPDCAPDELVGVSLPFPTCWNGSDLDSADHRSHMAYTVRDPETGISSCPPSHPVPLPAFTLGIWFEHDGNSSQWYLSSDRMPDGPEWDNGASFHADWFGGWDPDIQQVWTEHCINGLLNCSGGQLGDGNKLDGLVDYTGPTRLDPPER